MANFSDDFERADGPLGGNWSVLAGAAALVGGKAVTTNETFVHAVPYSSSGNQEVTITFTYVAGVDGWPGVLFKWGGPGSDAYVGYLNYSDRGANVTLWSFVGPARNVLGTHSGAPLTTGAHTFTCSYLDGEVTCKVDSVTVVAATDTHNASSAYAGIYSNYGTTRFDSFSSTSGPAATLGISPSPIPNFGKPSILTFTGTLTHWTPGSPGVPVFTVDHGTLSVQQVTSATRATAIYDPGTFLGLATFTDPSNGNTAQILVTSDPTIIPTVGGFALSAEAVAYIERSAAAETNATIVNRQEQIQVGILTKTVSETISTIGSQVADPTEPVGGVGSLLALIIQVYDLLNGGNNWGGAATVFGNTSLIKSDTDTALTRLDLSQVGGSFSTGSLARALAGFPGGTHQDILDAIATGGGSDQAVLDSIAGVKGDPLATIKAVLDQLFVIRTPTGYDLGDVLAAIGALPHADPPDLTPVLNKLTQIQPSALVSLSTILDALVGANTITNIVNVAIAALTGRAGSTVSGVIDLIGDLSSQVAAIAPVAAPLWPGVANARVSERVTLVDGLVVEGPLKGVLVDITDTPTGAASYIFGGVYSWKHSGGVIFQSDEGAYERAESLGLESQIIVPKTMEIAARAIFRTYPGWHGSVRSWTSGPLTE